MSLHLQNATLLEITCHGSNTQADSIDSDKSGRNLILLVMRRVINEP